MRTVFGNSDFILLKALIFLPTLFSSRDYRLGSGMMTEMCASAHDSEFDAEDRCTFTVDGLLQTEYGIVKGEVASIAIDTTMSGIGFPQGYGIFDATGPSGKDGGGAFIINGMTARV